MENTSAKNANHKCQVGDILAVPLPDARYAFVRIININDGWDLVEVLAATAAEPRLDPSIHAAPPLYPPVAFALDDVKAGLMIPIGRTPDFSPAYLHRLWYRRGRPGRYLKIRVNQNKSEGSLSEQEAADLPDQEFHDFATMVERIQQRFASGQTVARWLSTAR